MAFLAKACIKIYVRLFFSLMVVLGLTEAIMFSLGGRILIDEVQISLLPFWVDAIRIHSPQLSPTVGTLSAISTL